MSRYTCCRLGAGLVALALVAPEPGTALASSLLRTPELVAGMHQGTPVKELRARVPAVRPVPAGSSTSAVERLQRTSVDLQQLGVDWYALSRTADGGRLALLSPAGTERGAFTVRYRRGEGRTLSPVWLDSGFPDPGSLTLQVWGDVRESLLDRIAVAPTPAGALEKVTAASTPCDWSWLYKSGWYLGGTRSLACERATLDVNGKCSNSACWGCCQLLDCDCACAYGDLTCLCVRLGYPCARQGNCDWQIIPDPETCDDPGGGDWGGGGGGTDPGGGGGGIPPAPTCVDVYCNGDYAGQACGTSTQEIVDDAWSMCP